MSCCDLLEASTPLRRHVVGRQVGQLSVVADWKSAFALIGHFPIMRRIVFFPADLVLTSETIWHSQKADLCGLYSPISDIRMALLSLAKAR